MSTWYEGGLADGRKALVVRRDQLHQSMVDGFADGLDSGVPVALLDGYRAYHGIAGMVTVNTRRARSARLSAQITQLEKRAKKARDLAAQEDDPADQDAYREDARNTGRQARALRAELADLKRQIESMTLPPTFDSEAQFLLAGLRALLTPGGLVDPEQERAIQRVIDGLELAGEGRHVRWRAWLLLPVDGRVARVGPFTGLVDRVGREPTPGELRRVHGPTGSAIGRRDLIHRLVDPALPDDRRLPDCLARAVTCAPTDHLARVLLGEDVRWPDCGPDFDHDRFNHHLRSQWTPDKTWAKGVYCHTNQKRQTLVDVVAALGGLARLDQLQAVADDLGYIPSDLYPLTSVRRSANASTPPWPSPVRRTGDWTAASYAHDSFVENILCPRCGQPATAVVRVLENPDALLCRTCLVAPSFPDQPFPPLYAELALPPTVIPDEVLARAQEAVPGLKRKGRRPRTQQRSAGPEQAVTG